MSQIQIGLTNNNINLNNSKSINCIKGRQLDCLIEPVNGTGGIYIGNIEAAKNLELLDSLKIRSVLTLEDSFDFCYFGCKVSTHKVIKIKDRTDVNMYDNLIPALQFVDRQREQTNVLIHCFAGVSRSSTICIAYLMARFGMGLKQAFLYVKNRRNVIQPNRKFMVDLIRFEQFIKEKESQNMAVEAAC